MGVKHLDDDGALTTARVRDGAVSCSLGAYLVACVGEKQVRVGADVLPGHAGVSVRAKAVLSFTVGPNLIAVEGAGVAGEYPREAAATAPLPGSYDDVARLLRGVELLLNGVRRPPERPTSQEQPQNFRCDRGRGHAGRRAVGRWICPLSLPRFRL